MEIYEWMIKENGLFLELCIGLVDSFVLCGYFEKVFDMYVSVFRFGNLI